MRLLTLLTIFLLVIPCLDAQMSSGNSSLQCAFDQMHNQEIQENLKYKTAVRSFNDHWQFYTPLSRKNQYTLPVVVHIIHDNGLENISNMQVTQAIDYLNAAFSNRAYYDPSTGVDTEIEFCLAQRTPDNLSTDGITRTISTLTTLDIESEDLNMKDLARWDPTAYINIWVVREICHSNGCSVAGYASFPPAHGQDIDGIVIEAASFGTSGAETSILIHEMGHFLGLYHTFQGGCPNSDCRLEGDRICDTPPDQTTVRTSCDDNINSCETDEDDSSTNNPFRSVRSGGSGDQSDQFQNYMDYSNLECYDRFTQGQKNRMIYAIENDRYSLVLSPSCLSLCPATVTADISANSSSFQSGETIQLNGNTSNAVFHNWYLDGVLFSTDQNTDYTFSDDGIYTIVLEAGSNDPNCRIALDSIKVEVTCQAKVDFSYVLDGTHIELINQSTNSTRIEWSISELNGGILASSTNSSYQYTFYFSGWFEICLSASTDLCSSDSCIQLQIYAEENEICGNGVDDDGDGWVDYFDSDCPEHDSLYMAQPETHCNGVREGNPIGMKKKWAFQPPESHFDARNLVAGDIDNDGDVEIIAGGIVNRKRGLFVLNGKTGQLDGESSFGERYNLTSPCIADIDRDGFAEIFLVQPNNGRCEVVALNYRLDLLWSNEFQCSRGVTMMIPNIADINGDGVSELYIGAHIFNAHNGASLVHIDDQENAHNIMSIAADFLPDQPGLEIAFGNYVYSYQLNNLSGSADNSWIKKSINPGHPSWTAAADINGDELLDVVFIYIKTARNEINIVAWDPRTESTIAKTTLTGQNAGAIFCADVDNDCEVEIGFATKNKLNVAEYDGTEELKLKYSINTTDDSGRTGAVIFDFDQDGYSELVYRDQTQLRLMNGADGSEISSIPIKSGTWHEFPIIVDIDDDSEAEILVNGYDAAGIDMILAVESDQFPWAPTRALWNQGSYHVTNINDDLTVPLNPQNTATHRDTFCDCPNPYNAFLTQASYRSRNGCMSRPVFDAQIDIQNIACVNDSVIIEYQISNLADKKTIPENLVIGVYSNNPLTQSSLLLASDTLHVTLLPDEKSPNMIIQLPFSLIEGNLYLLANISLTSTTPFLFPTTQLFECNYENNIDSILLSIDPGAINLGSDTTICANQVFLLKAPDGYSAYLWSDGSTGSDYTVFEPGVHWVEVSNICGQSIRDTIVITVDPITKVEILSNSVFCEGDSIYLKSSHSFEHYQWFGLNPEYCSQCPELRILATENLDLILRVENEIGCFSSDSVSIEVLDTTLIRKQYSMCAGDSIFLENTWINTAGEYYFDYSGINGCDSAVHLDIQEHQFNVSLDYEVNCEIPEALVELIGDDQYKILWPDQSSSNSYTSSGGEIIEVLIIDTVSACSDKLTIEVPYLPNFDVLPQWRDTHALVGTTPSFDLGMDDRTWEVNWRPENSFSCPTCMETELLVETNPIFVELTHKETGCDYESQFSIDWQQGVFIPNAFSPNGDGNNDLWEIYHQDNIDRVLSVLLFNRWGNLVLEWKGEGPFLWDGTFHGHQAEAAVYAYYIELITQQGGMIVKKGDVTLIR